MTPEEYAAARDEYRENPARKNTFDSPANPDPEV
jgi:hypothetical protein